MSAKQGNSNNRIIRLCIYAVLVAVCLVIGYVESLLQLSFIAPGVKIGLSNAVACVLIINGDVKGAFAVNISRILLSALLFGSPVSLILAICGGVLSMCLMALFRKSKRLSVIGISALGGAVHNTAQCVAGGFLVGVGVLYYLPILLITGILCGTAVGVLSKLVLNRIGQDKKYV